MFKKVANTLIIDLDNTIFDWFAVWYASFNPIYEEVLRVSNLPAEEIEKDIRSIHQMRRTSEYTFLLEEMKSLAEIRKKDDIRIVFQEAIESARQARDQNLKLYPGVFHCLWEIKKRGTKIVAYTESMEFYSAYRLKRFGLDGVIDVLFSPEDHTLPAGISIDKFRRLPDEFYELQVTEVRHTPSGELKPNPDVLRQIIQAIGADADRCVYVGDSLFKDVAMAKDVGVFDIHAKYGESQRRPEYGLLQRVSHWTDDDVQREKDIIAKSQSVIPSVTLKDSFSEIFMHCRFDRFPNNEKAEYSEQDIKNVLEVWKKVVDVQQHFNDLSMRIRNFAITVVGALIAAVGVAFQYNVKAEAFGYKLNAGLGFVVAAGLAWAAFYFMDRYWYHVFLKGAVKHAGKIEKEFDGIIPGIGLGSSISKESGEVKIFCKKTNSEGRLILFYGLGFAMIFIVFVTLLLSGRDGAFEMNKSNPAVQYEQRSKT